MNRRAFTLLEVMLAAVLGSMVVLTAMVLFTTMARTQARTENSDFGLQELARLNNATRKALSQVVVYGFTPKRDAGALGAPAAQPVPSSSDGTPDEDAESLEVADPTGESSGMESSLESDLAGDQRGGGGRSSHRRLGPDGRPRPDPTKFPRMILENDLASGLQRLELVVAEPPALAGADGVLLEPDAGKRFTMTRGAFELRPITEQSLPRSLLESLDPTLFVYDVWWVPVDHNEEGVTPLGNPGIGFGPDGRSRAGGIVIARGITNFRWKFWRTDDAGVLASFPAATATARSELPAYLELEAQTVQGQKVKWMLEVGWTVQVPIRETEPAPGDIRRNRPDPSDPLTADPPDRSGRPAGGSPGGVNAGGLNSGGGPR